MISVETPRLSLSCEDVKALEEAFGQNESRFCDCTKWNTLLWGEYLSLSLLATERGKVLQREMMDGTPTYTALFPHTFTLKKSKRGKRIEIVAPIGRGSGDGFGIGGKQAVFFFGR